MDFVHVADVARATMLAATAPLSDAVFNVGSGVETTLKELAETLLSIMGSPLRPQHAPPRKVNGIPRRLASVDAACGRRAFRARMPVGDGLHSPVARWLGQ